MPVATAQRSYWEEIGIYLNIAVTSMLHRGHTIRKLETWASSGLVLRLDYHGAQNVSKVGNQEELRNHRMPYRLPG